MAFYNKSEVFKLSKMRGFATGGLLTAVVCFMAIGGVVYAFMSNSSPYVTVAQAKTSNAERMHLAGEIMKETVHQDLAKRTLTFDLKDEKGDTMTVVYTGTMPQNMGEAKNVVAIGSVKGKEFHSDSLLVKCPSKYESEKKS